MWCLVKHRDDFTQLQRLHRAEYDHEWGEGRDTEGGDRGLFEGIILVFTGDTTSQQPVTGGLPKITEEQHIGAVITSIPPSLYNAILNGLL
jgi:hypothetical protein